jgi:hypothetical protein
VTGSPRRGAIVTLTVDDHQLRLVRPDAQMPKKIINDRRLIPHRHDDRY